MDSQLDLSDIDVFNILQSANYMSVCMATLLVGLCLFVLDGIRRRHTIISLDSTTKLPISATREGVN
ncbi:hypothetical protein SERLADRAFT_401757 [Serpula lacrymans var. lacrymans S7.9]|uniref:Uncharacterized protein n=1 Tax=Serpula lacrymans var. lacrymans (strain S7.9) TaxID=578457 RepID=F8PB10_SERL9|nr:uncharacterized protein SERLADRAFT_401757 [Serpula lacrymans var. lacrymans S7.9]EGO19450.1 hypothetical protein SERLADRAFT_401757 [Serpula lacrymans var. lacrymans S7.9]